VKVSLANNVLRLNKARPFPVALTNSAELPRVIEFVTPAEILTPPEPKMSTCPELPSLVPLAAILISLDKEPVPDVEIVIWPEPLPAPLADDKIIPPEEFPFVDVAMSTIPADGLCAASANATSNVEGKAPCPPRPVVSAVKK
jgi:hypothetical protein